MEQKNDLFVAYTYSIRGKVEAYINPILKELNLKAYMYSKDEKPFDDWTEIVEEEFKTLPVFICFLCPEDKGKAVRRELYTYYTNFSKNLIIPIQYTEQPPVWFCLEYGQRKCLKVNLPDFKEQLIEFIKKALDQRPFELTIKLSQIAENEKTIFPQSLGDRL